MSLRTPKRIYTRTALEFWFERLVSDWEHYFSRQVLQTARTLYRKDEVSEIELGSNDAIIHCKREKQELYSLVEWTNGRLTIRASTHDRHFGNSLAVAGIYEIEELVADEYSSFPEQANTDHNKDKPLEAVASPFPQIVSRLKPTPKARPLTLRFFSTEQGLALNAFWTTPHQGPKPALLHSKKLAYKINSSERERLICLTTMAYKEGFQFSPHNHYYLLRETGRITPFLRHELPHWRHRFSVETDEQVAALSRGIQTIDIEIEAGIKNSALDFRWRFKLGQKDLTPEQTRLALRQRHNPTIIPDLGLIKIDENKADILTQWQSSPQESSSGTIPKYMLFSLLGQQKIHLVLSSELKQWSNSLFEQPPRDNRISDPLRPYQQRGVHWLAHLCKCDCHALLADEMGLGKTLQIIALIAHHPIPDKSHLIVCPASVVAVWRNEVSKFFPYQRIETLKSGHHFLSCPEPVIWLSSYTQLRRQKNLLDKVDFGYAVLDEAQFIKNPAAKVTSACMSIRARHRLVLTGTPIENKHLDLWTIFHFLMPGLLGGRREFEKAFQREGLEFLKKLHRQIAPFMLRRTKQDVMRELPPKVEMKLICPLTALQQREYTRLTEEGMKTFGEDIRTAVRKQTLSFFTFLTRLRQVCCDPDLLPWLTADLQQSGKINFFLDKVAKAIASGHKIVVFSQFVSLLKRVRRALASRFSDTPLYELTGKTADREKPIAQFQSSLSSCLILVSLKAGGTGITLHAADYVFLLDPWWNPAVEEQAIDRVHRIGQEKTVFVYRMITQGTIEERIEDLKASKRELFHQVVGRLNDASDFKNYFRSLSDLIGSLPSGNKT